MRRLALLGALALVAAACGGGDAPTAVPEPAPAVAGFEFASGAVEEGQSIDPRSTCDGDDVSPALSWTGAPDGTAELALVIEDPNAPSGLFTHWLVYRLSPDVTSLPEGVPGGAALEAPTALRQGENSAGEIGYTGPCPPEGQHRYVFRLLAVDTKLGLPAGADRAAFDEAVTGHTIAEARLTAVYERP